MIERRRKSAGQSPPAPGDSHPPRCSDVPHIPQKRFIQPAFLQKDWQKVCVRRAMCILEVRYEMANAVELNQLRWRSQRGGC